LGFGNKQLLVAASSARSPSLLACSPRSLSDRARFPGKLFRVSPAAADPPRIITVLLLMLPFPRECSSAFSPYFSGTAPRSSPCHHELFAGLQKLDRAQGRSFLDSAPRLGKPFWRVTLPNIKLSLIAAALLIFTLSMDEIAVTSSSSVATIPCPSKSGAPPPRDHAGNQRYLVSDFCGLRRVDCGVVSLRARSIKSAPQEIVGTL